MAPITISFDDNTTVPPVYVAGSFSEWQAIEIEAIAYKDEDGNDRYQYRKTFDLAHGHYQYKFRLGSGDWWVCDDRKPKSQDSDGNENNTLVVENDKMQQQPSEHKSDGNARVTSRKQEPKSKSSFEYNKMNGTSDHNHNLPESAKSTAKLDTIQPDHTNPLTSAVSDQEKKRQREAPEKVQLVQSSADQDRKTQNGVNSAQLEEEPGSTTAERKNASEDKTEISDSATSAVHSNGSPITSGKAFQESSNNLPKLKPVSGVGLEHSEAGSNDELEKRAESGTRSDSSSLWHNASSKRLLLIAIFLAVPIAMAYYLKKGRI